MEIPDALAEEMAQDRPTYKRPHYLKDINHLVTQAEAAAMITRAKQGRDRFITAFLYITGCRPTELTKVTGKDITQDGQGGVLIHLTTAKLGQRKGFFLKTRDLSVSKESVFMQYVLAYIEGFPPEAQLCPISEIRIRQIIYEQSDNQFCPYHFRHTRMTLLARMGLSVDQLMYWKGSSTTRSVSPYLANKPIGNKLLIA
jgi:integrase